MRIAEGDEQAFAVFFQAWATPMAAIAMKILQSEYHKQEVIQEVFIKVWLNRDKLEQVEKVGAWLRRITINQSLQALEKNAASDKRFSELPQLPIPDEHAASLEFKELKKLADEAVAALPTQRKMIYIMNRIEGKPTRQIAEELGLSHGYVRNALSAALSDIRDKLRVASPGILLAWLILLG